MKVFREIKIKSATVETYTVKIYMAGNVEVAKAYLQQACYQRDCPIGGLCTTVEPITFVHAGGEESGFVVGLVNYPKFPAKPDELFAAARELAVGLVLTLSHWWSALLVAPDKSELINVCREIEGNIICDPCNTEH